jgi:hypothetical protein
MQSRKTSHFELSTKKKKNGKEYLEGANNHKQKENRLIKPRIELYANNHKQKENRLIKPRIELYANNDIYQKTERNAYGKI